jgi:uncharacterized membrane protein YkoI
MSSKFKKGQLVRQIMPAPMEGKITRIFLDEEEGTFHYHVAVTNPDGSVHDTSFAEAALQALDEQDPPVLTDVIQA